MQFAVIGAGNMGCVYGANLARVGEQVTLLDVWEEHIRRIRADGLSMDGLHGKFTVRVEASTEPAAAPKADVALICVNAYATREAAQTASVILKDSGYALTLQNGLGNVESLTEVLGTEHVLAGLSFHSGDLSGPGHVTHTNKGPIYLGELDKRKTRRLAALCEAMQRAGLNPVAVDDIMAVIWSKFVHNCAINAICAITGLRPGHIRQVPELDEFQSHIINETLALLKVKGVSIPDSNPLEKIKAFCSEKFHRPSMLQHLERGQLTEVDALNGYVAQESRKFGLAAPYNDALTSLIKGREYRPTERTD
ncbi:MAG: ketopantoate reductase family protein [Acidobacteria bacterium]|nr:ketopantoate reductase family protein [Acidobacteriota bacterium]